MKLLTIAILTVLLVGIGCSQRPEQVSLSEQQSLRQMLDVAFDPASVPQERAQDFYHILRAFAAERRRDEFVRGILFVSATEADVSFSGSPNIHGGGGSATAKKIKGRWTITQKIYVI